MKEYLKTLVQSASSTMEARNQARDYLQALTLQSLQRTGAMTVLAFHGDLLFRQIRFTARYMFDLSAQSTQAYV